MIRILVAAALSGAIFVLPSPTLAQVIPPLGDGSGLEGGPSTPRASDAAAKREAERLKQEQARLAREAAAQKAEQARLAKQAADLKAEKTKLDTRAAELAAEEKRLAQTRRDAGASPTTKDDQDLRAREARLEARAEELAAEEKRLAQLRRDVEAQKIASETELSRIREETNGPARRIDPGPVAPPVTPDDEPRGYDGRENRPDARPGTRDFEDDGAYYPRGVRPPSRGSDYSRIRFDAAERSCTRAAHEAARERDYDTARYDGAPRFYRGEGLELRGRMRLMDGRAYRLVNTVCELDAYGEAVRFAFLR